jgi:hypothetical protein
VLEGTTDRYEKRAGRKEYKEKDREDGERMVKR